MQRITPFASILVSLLCWAGASRGQELNVVETDQTIVVQQNGHKVLTYNKVSPPAPAGIDPTYERSGCLHPVVTPKGTVVTQMFPVDHPHQHGVFSAWVRTRYDGHPIDFWNLAGDTGTVLHERVVSRFSNVDSAGFEVDILHRGFIEGPIDILRERWRISAYPTDGSYFCFDLESTQNAMTDKPLTVGKYHYGGFALRGPTTWLTRQDSYAKRNPGMEHEPSGFLSSLGSDRVAGNHEHARWIAMWGKRNGQDASLTVLSHPDNFRAPQAARLHPSKPYFCFSPCVDGSFSIDRDHPFMARYRFLVTDEAPDAKWIDRQWEKWVTK